MFTNKEKEPVLPPPHSNSMQRIELMNQEIFSKHSSVMKVRSKNYRVFTSIEKIKSHIPTSFYFFFSLLFLDIMFAFIYVLILSTTQSNYFLLEYNPSKLGMINFCQQYSAFSFATAIMIERENLYLNLTQDINESVFYTRILLRGFEIAQTVVNNERNSPPILSYQLIYRNYQTYVIDVDANPKTLLDVTYFELLDFYLTYIQYIENLDDIFEINYNFLIFLQRNFPYFLLPSAAIFNEIQSSFDYYNNNCSQYLMSILILFLAIMITVKFFEILQLVALKKYTIRLIAIFLRINGDDALKELSFLDEIFDEIQEKNEDFLYSSYAYKCALHQNEEKTLEKTEKKIKVKEVSKKTKHFKSNLNIRSFSQTKNWMLITIAIALSFCFYFFNYYYWLLVNEDIQGFISLNISFASVYVYSSSILTSNNNCLREKIITNNTSYEAIINNYQDPTSRIDFFLSAINKRMPIITDVAANQMPNRIFEAEDYITDPNFHDLIHDNICQLLYKLDKIEQDEAIYCESIWDGSLQNGLLISINYYIEKLIDLGRLRNVTNETTVQITEILEYIEAPDHITLFLGDYYLNQALYLFYQYIGGYYDNVIEGKMQTMQILLIVTEIFFTLIVVGAGIIIWKFMKRFKKDLAMMLSLMPYEKITDDDATYQIINNFLK